MFFEDTVLVPKLQLEPPRELAQSFAPVRPARWPWIAAAAIVLLGAVATPLPSVERQLQAERIRQSLSVP